MAGSREELRLRARIASIADTVTEPLWIGPVRLRFTRVTNPDAVLDRIVAETDELERKTGVRQTDPQHLPYWAELWDSAWGLAVRVTDIAPGWGLRPKHVLDLGCGMGLCGAVAATLGATVVLADLEPEALLVARLNTLRFGKRARCRRVDWQRDLLDERFDVILGADILYERSQWPHLYRFFDAHLAPGGTVLLGEPGRQTGEAFVATADAAGWHLTVGEQRTPSRDRPIRIFELTRPTVASPLQLIV